MLLVVLAALAMAGCTETQQPSAADVPVADAAPSRAETPREKPTKGSRAKPKPRSKPRPQRPIGVAAVVAKITDGDTVVLRSGIKVRLIQIDTPEVYGGKECYGSQASAALAGLIPPGTRVRLEADRDLDQTDQYGRQLRYIHKGGTNVNLAMVQRGAASVWFYQGGKGRYANQLYRAVKTAKSAGRGLWGACPSAQLNINNGIDTGRLNPPAPKPKITAKASGSSADSSGGNPGLPTAPGYPPDVNCSDLPGPVWVGESDPHRLDRDGDGIGCDG